MRPWEKLSAVDIENIEYWIDRHGSDSGEWCLGSRAHIKDILRFWDADKQNLFNLFNQELILSKSIEIVTPKEELMDSIRDFVNNSNFVIKYRDFLYRLGHSPAAEFEKIRMSDEYNYNTSYLMSSLVEPYVLAYNKYDGNTFVIRDFNNKKIQIAEGCKAVKTLITLNKKFEFATKEEEEEFRIKHSQITNTKSLKGTLHLSIHPLDYITMSDNTCNWTSCMAWEHNGDYRQGTIEMMNSDMVVVAYLDSDKPFYLDAGDKNEKQWSNKKWRELFIVNEDVLMGIKGYPYNNRELEDLCLNWLRDLIDAKPECGFGPYDRNQQKIYNDSKNNWIYADGETAEVYVNIECDRMYNDIYDTHYGFINRDVFGRLCFDYSGRSICLTCGEDMTGRWDEEIECSYLECPDCADLTYCHCCGAYHSKEDMIYHDGVYYCDYCYDDCIRTCDCCNRESMKDEMYKIYLTHLGKYSYSEAMSSYNLICEDCFCKFQDEFNLHSAKFTTWYNEWVIDLECVPKTEENWDMLMNLFCVDERYLEGCWNKIVEYVNMEDVKREEMYQESLKAMDTIKLSSWKDNVFSYYSPDEPIKPVKIAFDPWNSDMEYKYITIDTVDPYYIKDALNAFVQIKPSSAESYVS